jgi:hypothetical protein
VVTTQTDDVAASIRTWPDALARELHQVLQYGSFLDHVDGLDRFVDKAWSVGCDAYFEGVESVTSMYDTLAAWMDDFQRMLTVLVVMGSFDGSSLLKGSRVGATAGYRPPSPCWRSANGWKHLKRRTVPRPLLPLMLIRPGLSAFWLSVPPSLPRPFTFSHDSRLTRGASGGSESGPIPLQLGSRAMRMAVWQ